MKTGTVRQEERIKKVVISVDKNGRPQTSDECIVLDRTKNEEILWDSTEEFRIDFKGDSPFYEDQFDRKHACSGLARRGVLGSSNRTYKYTVEIKGQILDPGVKINP